MGWIYPHTGYSLLSLVQTSGNWCETACGTSLNKVDLGQIRGEVKANECQIIWVIAVQSKHDENTIRLLLNADDTNWERKIKGSTRRKEQKFKFVSSFKPSRKCHSTVGEAENNGSAVLYAWVHQLETEALAPSEPFNDNPKKPKSIRTLLSVASSELEQEELPTSLL